MDVKLNSFTKEAIKERLGKDVDSISRMYVDDIDELIQKKFNNNKKLTYRTRFRNLVGRGSVYLYFERLFGMEEIDKRLSKI